MKFFTKQLHEQLQVWSFLMNFTDKDEGEEGSEEIREYYQRQGKDYDIEQKLIYEETYRNTKTYLLKYLPESLRDTINNDFSVYGKMPNGNITLEIEKYRSVLGDLLFNDSKTNIFKIYHKYYQDIKDSLSIDIQNLNEKYSFHDLQILSLESKDTEQIVIKLNCKGSYLPSDGIAILTFNNVKLAELDGDYTGNWWLWDETHLSDIGNFDFQAILHSYNDNKEHSLNEFRIVADEVSISFAETSNER